MTLTLPAVRRWLVIELTQENVDPAYHGRHLQSSEPAVVSDGRCYGDGEDDHPDVRARPRDR